MQDSNKIKVYNKLEEEYKALQTKTRILEDEEQQFHKVINSIEESMFELSNGLKGEDYNKIQMMTAHDLELSKQEVKKIMYKHEDELASCSYELNKHKEELERE